MVSGLRFAVLGMTLLMVPVSGCLANAGEDVVLVLDNSGSMRKNDPDFQIKDGVAAFIERLEGDVRVAVLIFDETADLEVPLTEVNDTGKPVILASLDRIDYRGQFTDTGAAMQRAMEVLKQGDHGGRQKFIVFLTDGIVDTGDPAKDKQTEAMLRGEFAEKAAQEGIRVIGIAFTAKADHELIRTMADATDGDYFPADFSGDLEGVLKRAGALITSMSAASVAAQQEGMQGPAGETVAADGAVDETAPTEAPADTAEDSSPPLSPEPDAVPDTGSAGEQEAQEGAAVEAGAEQAGEAMKAEAEQAGEAMEAEAEQSGQAMETGAVAEGQEETGESEHMSDSTVAAESASGAAVTAEQAETVAADGATTQPTADTTAAAITDSSTVEYVPWLVLALSVVLLGSGAYLVRRRRREPAPVAGTTVVTPAFHERPIPVAFLDDIGGVTEKQRYALMEKTIITRSDGPVDANAGAVRIPENTVSRLHATIEYDTGAFWLTDCGSANGTFRNDQKVTGRQRLRHGDRIRFHTYEFIFLEPEASATTSETVLAPFQDQDNADRTVAISPNEKR
jgi:uncharacterized protein YegL